MLLRTELSSKFIVSLPFIYESKYIYFYIVLLSRATAFYSCVEVISRKKHERVSSPRLRDGSDTHVDSYMAGAFVSAGGRGRGQRSLGLGARHWDWHWLQKHSDIGLCTEQRAAAGCQLTLVLGSWSGGSGIKRPYSSHLGHYGKQSLSDGIV